MPKNYEFNTFEIIFQMVIPPMMIPTAPIPIASNKKFFRSAIVIVYFEC